MASCGAADDGDEQGQGGGSGAAPRRARRHWTGRPSRLVAGRTVGRWELSESPSPPVREASLEELGAPPRELLEAIVQAAPDGIVLVDGSGTIVLVNPAAEQLFGYEPEALLGESIELLIHPARRAEHVGLREGFHARPQVRPMGALRPVRGVHRDGTELEVEVALSPLAAEGGAGLVVALVRDVRPRRELERTQAELAQLRRLEGIGRFAAGVAHDFNNLLTVIMGCSDEIVRRHEGAGAQPPRGVTEVLEASERGANLTRQLLSFARRGDVRPAVLDLNEVLRDMLGMLGRLIGDHIQIRTDLASTACLLRADRGRIEQVILNLMANGRDAMLAGGEILLHTQVVDAAQCPADMGQAAERGAVMLRVQDGGPGLDPLVRERMFDPMFTTKTGDQGTGLGLSTTLSAVREANGSIRVSSHAGVGTTFEVFFPRCGASQPPVAAAALDRSSRLAGQGRRVLVVDDDVLVRRVVERVVRAVGFDVIVADGARAALDGQCRVLAPFDVAVVDVVMPDLRGPQLVQELRRRQPGMRALLTSGYIEELPCPSPQDAFLPKPFATWQLLGALEALLASGCVQR